MAGSNKNNLEEILRVKGLTHLDVGNEINLFPLWLAVYQKTLPGSNVL